jgi:hypothetical protein
MSSETAEDTDGKIERRRISVENLTLDSAQSRRATAPVGDEQDERLKESIKNTGVMQSLLVRPVDVASYEPKSESEYAIIAGSRRYHAAIEAGLRDLPCRIIHADDLTATILSYKENEERKDLSRIERAESLKMQFDLLAPQPPAEDEPWVCPYCGNEYTTSRGLHQHITRSDDHVTDPFEEGWVCPQCGDEFSGSKPLHDHVTDAPDHDTDVLVGMRQKAKPDTTLEQFTETTAGGNTDPLGMRQKAVTPQQAYKKLADEHFPDIHRTGDAVRKVKSLVTLASLPTSVRALFIHPDERSGRQKQVLSNFSISSDCTIALKHTSTVREFYDDLHHIQLEGLDPTDAVLRAVSKFDSQSASELGATIRKFKDNLTESESEETADDESSEADEGEEQEQEQDPDESSTEDTQAEDDEDDETEPADDQLTDQSFDDQSFVEALEEHQEQHESDESGSDESGSDDSSRSRVSATVRFNDDRHKRLHEKAKQTLSTTSDTEVVRKAHQAYLEQLAEKHEWNVTDDSADE